jgi:signal transduction histidine kinase
MQPVLLEDSQPTSRSERSAADLVRAAPTSVRLEALGLMTAGIVHDLGNIFQILSSTVDVLGQHPTIKATTALQPTMGRAVTSLERARAMIDQILSFARVKDNERSSVDLATCLEDLRPLLCWIGRNEMSIKIEVSADAPAVFCNRWNLESAILNLALNARDAMPDGGALSITATPCSNGGIVMGAAIRVSDTGRGMSPETVARAFDPFFSTKADARGNGLGLTMVQRFAQEIGGSVTIDSKLGMGTAVTLLLPQRPRPRS